MDIGQWLTCVPRLPPSAADALAALEQPGSPQYNRIYAVLASLRSALASVRQRGGPRTGGVTLVFVHSLLE